eukprot:GGOE01049523.1.p1 GENE.GGOE01049523.1~~GGOE01049523.1.p1  ORF type:complete len:616 (+),score=191.23 GGOE01049523.1:131-1849(+)
MDNVKFSKLCRDTKLFDKGFNASDADVVFAKAKGRGERRISFATFREVALPLIAAEKGCAVGEVVAYLKAAEGPLCSGTKADVVKWHDDKSTFTGVSGWKALQRASLEVGEVPGISPKAKQSPKSLHKQLENPKKHRKKKKKKKKAKKTRKEKKEDLPERDTPQSNSSEEEEGEEGEEGDDDDDDDEDDEDDSPPPSTPTPIASPASDSHASGTDVPPDEPPPSPPVVSPLPSQPAAAAARSSPSPSAPTSPLSAFSARPLASSASTVRQQLRTVSPLPRANTVHLMTTQPASVLPRRSTLPTEYPPPMRPTPLQASGFCASNFKVAYNAAKAPGSAQELLDVLQALLTEYAVLRNIETTRARLFFEDLKDTAVKELHSEVQLVAARLWTSPRTLDKKELCFILNELLREDHGPLMPLVAVIARAINLLLVNVRLTGGVCGVVYRGGGLPDEHRGFYVPSRTYRVPMFLATSVDRNTSVQQFCRRAGLQQRLPPVLWVVHLDQQVGCMHVNHIKRSECEGEEEYLFSPYSVFTVQEVTWKEKPTWQDPHVVHLLAAADNRLAPETLPLAPWA